MEQGRQSSVSDRMDDVTALSPLLMAEEAEKGDELANELILEMARCLGTATTSIVHVIDPTMVLLGGAMTFGRHETRIGRDFISCVREEFRRRAFPVLAEKVTIDYAALGGSAGFVGAAGCARRAASQVDLTKRPLVRAVSVSCLTLIDGAFQSLGLREWHRARLLSNAGDHAVFGR